MISWGLEKATFHLHAKCLWPLNHVNWEVELKLSFTDTKEKYKMLTIQKYHSLWLLSGHVVNCQSAIYLIIKLLSTLKSVSNPLQYKYKNWFRSVQVQKILTLALMNSISKPGRVIEIYKAPSKHVLRTLHNMSKETQSLYGHTRNIHYIALILFQNIFITHFICIVNAMFPVNWRNTYK